MIEAKGVLERTESPGRPATAEVAVRTGPSERGDVLLCVPVIICILMILFAFLDGSNDIPRGGSGLEVPRCIAGIGETRHPC